MQVVGTQVYNADGDGRLQVVDARDPADKAQSASYRTAGLVWAVQAVGDLVYMADGPGGLQIAHVTAGKRLYLPIVRR